MLKCKLITTSRQPCSLRITRSAGQFYIGNGRHPSGRQVAPGGGTWRRRSVRGRGRHLPAGGAGAAAAGRQAQGGLAGWTCLAAVIPCCRYLFGLRRDSGTLLSDLTDAAPDAGACQPPLSPPLRSPRGPLWCGPSADSRAGHVSWL